MNEADLVVAEADLVVLEALQARMAELTAKHQANVEAVARATAGEDWSALPALREESKTLSREIKSVYEALNAP